MNTAYCTAASEKSSKTGNTSNSTPSKSKSAYEIKNDANKSKKEWLYPLVFNDHFLFFSIYLFSNICDEFFL